MGRLRTEINYWLPFGYSIAYVGDPKTRLDWVKLTWRGYVAMWKLLLYAGWLIGTASPFLAASPEPNPKRTPEDY